MWFGYARVDLLPADLRRGVAPMIHDYAAHAGFGEGTVVFEPIAAEVLLREMLAELDRDDPAATTQRRLVEIARSWRVDLEQVLRPWPRAEVLWQIIETTAGVPGAHLIVPSREHLADLGPSGRAAVAELAKARMRIHHLDAIVDEPDEPLSPSYTDARVLVESRLGSIPAVAQLDAATELFRLGRIAAVQSVDSIYAAMINDPTRPTAGVLEFPSDIAPAVIRLLGTASGQLVVELEEPHPRMDEIAASLAVLCESSQRFIDGGRTFTRCALPLEASDVVP
ncbi:hypothetical protein OHB26_27630 [Nocardia sp. NBC_01503]|uniref:hypothetical protein n=1 Tax=Nocardia sp. NBC_01503 TaxID=2975997 RepID=UPI002E7C06E9|nr:hypothetical protein [Nocardia sp. NBC_01503]WTL30681.1 hypothetical protein OHB26_27630 [Nocardia sp. NBC_01503]